ncbi:MAG: cytidine deaminase [Oscillospiraceae bacterium]|jgi:cytidine deaminase|nr:cytidine deaminase [Oscillospiraceae bacterium]
MNIELQLEATGWPLGLDDLLSAVGDACLSEEGLQGAYRAGLLVIDDARMAALNKEQRGIAHTTDVLSFPSITYPNGETARLHAQRLRQAYEPESGEVYLGDIVISLPRAGEQAISYGHALSREAAFLFAHGLLHLLGYDHETDEGKAQMRALEERAMEITGISRELTDHDFELVAQARQAMRKAYAPYSRYRVGACVRAEDGRLFPGCNVENASYGLSICAERSAVTRSVFEGARRLIGLAVAGEGSWPTPCGACRQVLREFAVDMPVLLVIPSAIRATTLSALLPDSFGPEHLTGGTV